MIQQRLILKPFNLYLLNVTVAHLIPIQPILSSIVVLGCPNSSWCPSERVSKFPAGLGKVENINWVSSRKKNQAPKRQGSEVCFRLNQKKTRKMGRLGGVGEVRNLKHMGPSIVAMIFGLSFGFLGWDFVGSTQLPRKIWRSKLLSTRKKGQHKKTISWQIAVKIFPATWNWNDTPWKINMEPTNHPFGKENDLPNLHNYVPC